MNSMDWVLEDPIKVLSTDLRELLKSTVRSLYSYNLANAKEAFDKLIQNVEVDLAVDHVLVDELVLKLSKDLNGYVGFEDAVWLLGQRVDRASGDGFAEAKFRSVLNCAILTEQSDDADLTRVFNERLLNEADYSQNPVKKLVANVMLAMAHHRQKRKEDLKTSVDVIRSSLRQEETSALIKDAREENVFYLIVAFERIAFLLRKSGDKEGFNYYHRKALNLCQRKPWDLGIQMELETYLVRALKTSGSKEDVQIYVDSLLLKIQQALQNMDLFETRYGMKVLRDSYNDVSVAWSFMQTDENTVLSVGEQIFDKWKNTYGSEHHEVLFIASQLAYNYESWESTEQVEKYLAIVESGLEKFPETTKMIMQAKAKALIHLWKIHRNKNNLDEAEYYCREELRINRKHGLNQQYVANALRNLAFIVRDQERWEEALNYLKECLQLSREHNPDLTAFHEKVENEIKKF